MVIRDEEAKLTPGLFPGMERYGGPEDICPCCLAEDVSTDYADHSGANETWERHWCPICECSWVNIYALDEGNACCPSCGSSNSYGNGDLERGEEVIDIGRICADCDRGTYVMRYVHSMTLIERLTGEYDEWEKREL